MTLLQLSLAGWLAGLVAYLLGLGLIHGEWISWGDLVAVAFSSFIAFSLCYWLVYLPVLRLMRLLLSGSRPTWLFVVAAILLGVLPTALIARFFGGSFRAIFTPEAALFLILFTAVGLVVGFGYTRLLRRDTAA
jgi:hypothetical protein